MQTEALTWFNVLSFVFIIMIITYIADRYHSKLFTFLACLGLVLASGLRHGYVDTRAYRNGFINLNISEIFSISYFQSDNKEKGFGVLQAIIKLFTDDSQVFIFIMALLTVGCLYYAFVNYSPSISMAIFLFICTCAYLDTMNGMRQALVSAILFFCLPQMREKNQMWRYIIVVLLCTTIHLSAILFIPLYFVMYLKPWSKWTVILFVAGIVMVMFFNSGVGNALATILEGTDYGSDYGSMLVSGSTSVNIIRPMVALAPLVVAFMDRKNKKLDFGLYRISFNMSLVNSLIWLFATQMKFFYRLAMYFAPYMIVLLCYELYYYKNPRDRAIIKLAAIVLFFVWHIYSLHVTGADFFEGYLRY